MLRKRLALAKLELRLWVGSVVGRMRYKGDAVHCPVCERSFQRFLGVNGRANGRCPNCGARERHRLLWRYFGERVVPWLRSGGPRVVLDIAPSRAVRGPFRALLGDAYVSAGLQDRAWVVEDLFMDITDIQQPDGSYDVILCYHVLEHVEDDAKALSELRRVLKDDGLAIVDVPPWAEGCEETYEDPAITTPAGRTQAFGQHDHVRRYGKDFLARLRAAGLHAEVVRACDVYSDQDARRHGFQGERFFLCAKSAAHPAFAGDAGLRGVVRH